jgi:anaerobic magnesium-protoporphyrin IX monomethyl ester cyclase
MSIKGSVVIVAPNSFERVIGRSWENQFQIVTKTGHLASLTNLDTLFNRPSADVPLDRGWKSTNPMAGYYLESFLKINGYDAHAVFDWDDDDQFLRAMKSDPLAIAFSTTYVTDNEMLASCVAAIRNVVGTLPIIVGGPYIWKQRLQMLRDGVAERQRVKDWEEAGVDVMAGCLFGPKSEAILRDPIYIASEFGEHTLARILEALSKQSLRRDLFSIPNLVIATRDGGWHATATLPEPVNLDEDYTRWDMVETVPSMVPIRTSIGCPYKCRYCDFIELHPTVIKRAPSSIMRELQLAKARGRSFFNLIDDNIFLTKARIMDLTRTIREHEIDVIWGGFFRVDRIDEDNIQDIYASGCRFGMCGIESGDDGQLERMRKGCRRLEIARGIELATAAGIKLVLTFIVGYPGETRDTIDSSVALINDMATGNKSYSSFQIYPFYLLPNTAADDLEYRKEFHLRGRHGEWSHDSMNSEEARTTWSPYMFRQIDSLPYDYYATDCPGWWDVKKRNEGFRLRRRLTVSFLDRAGDARLQEDFEDLYRLLHEGRSAPPSAPRWDTVLADRSMQPGERTPRVRLGAG